MPQVTGIVYVTVDGVTIQSKPGAKIDFGGFTKKPVMANGDLAGHAHECVPASVECTMVHRADSAAALEKIRNADDSVILFQTDTGVTYSVERAALENPPSLTGGEGDVSLRWTGAKAKKL